MIHKYLRLKYVMGIILLISILFLCFTVRKTKKCVSGDCENGEGVASIYILSGATTQVLEYLHIKF